jgi:hypothetical protein
MIDDSTNAQVNPQIPKSNPALKNMGRLVGKWDIELIFLADPSNKIQGQAVFGWLEGEAFVIEHFGSSIWIIGPDDSTETYCTLYHDERGVSRVYQMSLRGDTWKLWRNAPGFSQRFEGKLSDDDNTITAHWEKSSDGSTWEYDFDLTYKRVK